MTNGFAERLRVAISNAGTIQKLAERAEVAPRTISGYLVGKGDPSRVRLVALAHAGQVSVEWLATGRGVLDSHDSNANDTLRSFAIIPQLDPDAVSDELGEEIVRAGPIAIRRDWLEARGLCGQDMRLITAHGDSMQPTISDGDLVLIDTSVRELRNDGLYAIKAYGRARFRRLQQDIRGGVWVISDAPHYEDEHLGPAEADELRIVGRATRISRDV
ncbi:MAG: S24 family peptidase [Halofilum sp. (in: g-proteobacteria)]